jgi:hypothetical protein
MLRDTWHSYLPPAPFVELTSFGLEFSTAFYPLFRGSFWRPSGVQNDSCMVPLESLRSILSNIINFAQIRAWTIGVFEQFFCVFLAKIPAKSKMLPANRELHIIAKVTLFLKFPDLWTNS